MPRIKFSEYCKQNGIAYLTGYRWFKDGKLPVQAIQTESGTILVDVPEITNEQDTTLFLQKAFEFSQNNASINDFAAHVLSNFSLKSNLSSNINKTNFVPQVFTCSSNSLSNTTYFVTNATEFSSSLSTESSSSINICSNLEDNIPLAQSNDATYNKNLPTPKNDKKKSKKELK